MGLKAKSLIALGLKSLRNLIWTGKHYRHRKVRTHDNGELYWLCYTRDLKDQFEVTINNGNLFNMGLIRDEEHKGRIVKHKQRIENMVLV